MRTARVLSRCRPGGGDDRESITGELDMGGAVAGDDGTWVKERAVESEPAGERIDVAGLLTPDPVLRGVFASSSLHALSDS